jgi:transcriptional regulator GlxA family with amidase domain
MAEQQKLRVGVFIPAPVQFLDLGAADIIAMLDPAYLASCQLPPPLVAMGIPTTIDYISTPESGDCVPTTASANIHVTKTIDDPSAQAGSFDIVLVPGPDPATIINEKARAFLKSHADWMGDDGKTTDILSVCTGCFIAGQAGVFKGKKASGPRPVVGTLQKLFPDTEWINDKRWVNDGNIWSSGKFPF